MCVVCVVFSVFLNVGEFCMCGMCEWFVCVMCVCVWVVMISSVYLGCANQGVCV